jgi:phosphoglycerate kinase
MFSPIRASREQLAHTYDSKKLSSSQGLVSDRIMKSLRDFNFNNKRVLIRVGFNVPFFLGESSRIDDEEDWRIQATLPTIKYLVEHKAKLILLTHLGRPEGKIDEKLRLDMISERLTELLKLPVVKLNDCLGPEVEMQIRKMAPGDIVLLENIRFHPGEEANSLDFSKKIAALGDIYVNDAFSVSHRNHASVVGLPKYLPSCFGLLFEKEVQTLSKVLDQPEHPLTAIIGGGKISTKIKFVKNFLNRSDNLLLAGALANTVINAKGFAIGQSVSEKSMIGEVKKLNLTSTKLHIPVDVVVSKDVSGKASSRISPVGNTAEDEMILDIGPDTIQIFSQVISQSKMIIWNGPLGFLETEKFSLGSEAIANKIAESYNFSLVGGGDTVAFLEKLKLIDKITHISTGGGAMLKFLAGEKLPGIEALK